MYAAPDSPGLRPGAPRRERRSRAERSPASPLHTGRQGAIRARCFINRGPQCVRPQVAQRAQPQAGARAHSGCCARSRCALQRSRCPGTSGDRCARTAKAGERAPVQRVVSNMLGLLHFGQPDETLPLVRSNLEVLVHHALEPCPVVPREVAPEANGGLRAREARRIAHHVLPRAPEVHHVESGCAAP